MINTTHCYPHTLGTVTLVCSALLRMCTLKFYPYAFYTHPCVLCTVTPMGTVHYDFCALCPVTGLRSTPCILRAMQCAIRPCFTLHRASPLPGAFYTIANVGFAL